MTLSQALSRVLSVAGLVTAVGLAHAGPGSKQNVASQFEPVERLTFAQAGVVPGAVVQRDSAGTVRRLRGSVSVPLGVGAVETAGRFLRDYRDLFGLSADAGELEVRKVNRDLGMTDVRYRQMYQGLPVFGGDASVHFDQKGNVVWVNNGVKQLSGTRALSFALPGQVAIAQARLSAGGAVDPRWAPKADRVVWPAQGQPKAAYRVWYRTLAPWHSWEVVVDAENGTVLRKRDLLQHVTGTGLVFDPNPVATSGNAGLVYNVAVIDPLIDAQRVTRNLPGLDNSTFLEGQFATTLPSTSIARANDAFFNFNYHYNATQFDEVMAYYHTDTIQRYIQSLGFMNVNNRNVGLDVDGIPDDNSFYDPATTNLTFGRGGVPDAQDADVVWHENGHAIQDDQVNGFGASAEGGAMGEGFGDYWAFSHGAGIGPNSPAWDVFVFKWDATAYNPGAPAFLRRMDSTKHYPQDIVGEVHADGELWSACLRQMFLLLGKTQSDTVVLSSHFLLPTTASFADGSNAILARYLALFGSANYTALQQIFVDRGFILPGAVPSNLTASPNPVVGGNNVVGVVTLSSPAPAGGQIVALTSDQVIPNLPASINIDAGSTTKSFSFTPNGVDAATTFSIHATAAGVTVNRSITVNPATLSNFYFSPATVVGGNTNPAVIVLNGKAGPSGIVVNMSTSSAKIHFTGPVTVPAQASAKSFTVYTDGVAANTLTTSTATQPAVAPRNANLTLTPANLLYVALVTPVIIGGNQEVVVVRLDGVAATNRVVNLTTPLPNTNLPASVTVLAGQVSAAAAFVPSGVDVAATGPVTASHNLVNRTANLTVNPAALLTFYFSPFNVAGGNNVAGVVKLNGFAGPSGRVVTLSSPSANVVLPASATVTSNTSAKSFGVTTLGVNANTVVNCTATSNAVNKTGTITLTRAAALSATPSAATVVGGTSFTVVIRLTGKAGPGGTVFSLSDNSVKATTPATATVLAGQTAVSFTVTTSAVAANTPVTVTCTGPAGVGVVTANVTLTP